MAVPCAPARVARTPRGKFRVGLPGRKCVLALGLSLALAQGLAPAGWAAEREPGKRPSAEVKAERAEAGLWQQADEVETNIAKSAELNRDPALNAYVRDTACKVAGPFCPHTRVSLLDRPFFNAAMYPNGHMEVWSGLLLRVETQDQLAFVLAHEIEHFTNSHSLQTFETVKERTAMLQVINIGAQFAGAGLLATAAMYGTLASLFGYSRELETQADAGAVRRAHAGGFDPRAGVDIWRSLINEAEKADDEKVRKEIARSSIFDSHPIETSRIEAIEKISASLAVPAGGQNALPAASDPAHHRAAIRPFLVQWLRDELRLRDFGRTLFLISRLEKPGLDQGVLAYFRGEAHRLRRKGTEDALAARQAYERAITFADSPPEAYRELADLRQRAGDLPGALDALGLYLEKAPQAPDRALMERRLANWKTRLSPAPAASTPTASDPVASAPTEAATAAPTPPAPAPPAPAPNAPPNAPQ